MRGLKSEKAILAVIREKVGNDYMAYWIAWKYAPDILPHSFKTYKELCDYYKALANQELTEKECERFLYYDKVQNAIRWLLKKQKNAKMIELYNLYFEQAKKDPSALKEFLKLQDIFFKDDEMSELESILRGSNFDDSADDEEETYKMEL